MGIYAVKPRFRGRLRRVEVSVIAAQISADQVTFAGLAFGLAVAGAVLLSGRADAWLLAIPALVLARLACNALDGMIAVDTGTARPLGQVFNEFSDRLADSVIVIAITLRSGTPTLGLFTLSLMLMTSYLGTVAAAAGGTRQYGGVMGKADRMVLLCVAAPTAALMGGWPILPAYLAIVALGCVVTMLQRARDIHRELRGATER